MNSYSFESILTAFATRSSRIVMVAMCVKDVLCSVHKLELTRIGDAAASPHTPESWRQAKSGDDL